MCPFWEPQNPDLDRVRLPGCGGRKCPSQDHLLHPCLVWPRFQPPPLPAVFCPLPGSRASRRLLPATVPPPSLRLSLLCGLCGWPCHHLGSRYCDGVHSLAGHVVVVGSAHVVGSLQTATSFCSCCSGEASPSSFWSTSGEQGPQVYSEVSPMRE